MKKVLVDNYGAKTYETGTVVDNTIGLTRDYSIVDNGGTEFMLHVAHHCYVCKTLPKVKKLLVSLSEEHDFTIHIDEETKLQQS